MNKEEWKNFWNITGIVTIVIIFILGFFIFMMYADEVRCENKAKYIGLEGEFIIDKLGYGYCIYTLENGRKVHASDYTEVMINE